MKILHISDLHLGNDFIPRAVLSRRRWWKKVMPELKNGLAEAIRAHNCDYIVISGDFVNKPNKKAFSYSAAFIREVLHNANVDIRKQVLAVPGNHDVSFLPYKHKDEFARLLPYRQFLLRLFDEKNLDNRKARFVHADPNRKLLFLALDTTSREGLLPGADGKVGRDQLRWAEDEIKGYQRLVSDFDDYVKIAIMHHHCVPLSGDTARSNQLMQLLDAGDVIQMLQKYSFNIVLHGHKHYPHVNFLLRSDSGAMTIVGAGTTTSPYLEEQRTFGNNYNLLEFDRDQVTITRFKANPAGQFQLDSVPQTKPLFRVSSEGYRASLVRQVVSVQPNGTADVIFERQEMRVDPGTMIRTLPVRLLVTKPGKFLYCNLVSPTGGSSVNWKIKNETAYDGDVVFNQPLTNKSATFDLRYEYGVENGIALQKSANQAVESTEVILQAPAGKLQIVVRFPKGYPVDLNTVEVRYERFGAPLDPASLPIPKITRDLPINEFNVTVTNPPLNVNIIAEWRLP
jgi:3',5'-cyclic AMP phosphodiesterase CpdA